MSNRPPKALTRSNVERTERLWLSGELRVLEHWALAIAHAAEPAAPAATVEAEPGVAEVCGAFGERLAQLRVRLEEEPDDTRMVAAVRAALHSELVWCEQERESALTSVGGSKGEQRKRASQRAFALLEIRNELHSVVDAALARRSS